jgi:hypothetical protein
VLFEIYEHKVRGQHKSHIALPISYEAHAYTSFAMDPQSKRMQALISIELNKVHVAIDGLTSLHDVPAILQEMVFRLKLLEHVMAAWQRVPNLDTRNILGDIKRTDT